MTLKSRKARVSDLEARHPRGLRFPLVDLGLTIGTLPGETVEEACKRQGWDYESLTRSRPLEEIPPGTARVNVTIHPSPKKR